MTRINDDIVACSHEGTPCPVEGLAGQVACRCSCSSCEEVRFWDNFCPPCGTCGRTGECAPDCAEDVYNRGMEDRVRRLGVELAMLPDWMECWECGHEHLMVQFDRFGMKFVWRRPVGLGPIAEAHRDPTQMYRLECGHLAM